jgi:O-Antigen ligase.
MFSTFNFELLFERFFIIGDAINNSDFQSILRFQLIMRGLYIFLDFPLMGAGIGTFHQFRHSYFETISISRSDTFIDSHNLYVQILAETGMIGFILFIAIFYFLYTKIKKLKRSNINLYSFLMGNIILYMFSGFFDHDLHRYYLLIPILIGAIYSENYVKSKKTIGT